MFTFIAEIWHPESFLQLVGTTVFWGILGVILIVLGIKLFDALNSAFDFGEELKKGNIAAGIFMGMLALAIAIVVHAAIAM